MRVLMLSRYSYEGPGSRVRMYQFLPYLRSQGLEIDELPLFADGYVRGLYQNRRASALAVAAQYFRRLCRLLSGRKYDVVWLQWELFPWLPDGFERLIGLLRAPYVVDFDDAIFHRYDMHRSPLVRRLLGRKIDGVMRRAACVVAGNPYLAERARQAGARRIEIIPSVIDTDRYSTQDLSDPNYFTVGWIGTPVTLPFLESIRPALAQLSQDPRFMLHIVGASRGNFEGVRHRFIPWTEDTEVEAIQRFNVGVMPLADDPWSRGKCGYKLIQYMGCAKPVVASPVGVNADIIINGENGFFATRSEDWLTKLRVLAAMSPRQQLRLGYRGRERAIESFSIQAAIPLLRSSLQDIR